MASLLIVNTLSELVRNIQCFGAIFVWKLKNEINIAQHTKNQITNNNNGNGRYRQLNDNVTPIIIQPCYSMVEY